jgi:hypothetical protein
MKIQPKIVSQSICGASECLRGSQENMGISISQNQPHSYEFRDRKIVVTTINTAFVLTRDHVSFLNKSFSEAIMILNHSVTDQDLTLGWNFNYDSERVCQPVTSMWELSGI